MSPSTRHRLTLCLAIALVALPAEAILLPVANTPDVAEAAVDWAASRSNDELMGYAEEMAALPVVYRRAIMAQLDPVARADTWRRPFETLLATDPELSATQRFILEDAISVLTPAAFTLPLGPDLQARIQQVYGETQLFFGADVARALFVDLGPENVQANALPFRQQLADKIRGWRAPMADQADCNCNPDIDTCTVWPEPEWLECSELFSCDFDVQWPMCGPLWSWACTGWCRVVENY